MSILITVNVITHVVGGNADTSVINDENHENHDDDNDDDGIIT